MLVFESAEQQKQSETPFARFIYLKWLIISMKNSLNSRRFFVFSFSLHGRQAEYSLPEKGIFLLRLPKNETNTSIIKLSNDAKLFLKWN